MGLPQRPLRRWLCGFASNCTYNDTAQLPTYEVPCTLTGTFERACTTKLWYTVEDCHSTVTLT